MNRHSLYWDDFEVRAHETAYCVKSGFNPVVRRVAVFVTKACNLKCAYCNVRQQRETMTQETFEKIVSEYGSDAIIHITGGEPGVVPWLYPYLRKYGAGYRFHLNTNAVVMPPALSVRRLKVSLDSYDASYWNDLVGRKVFDRVVKNIKQSIPHTVVSITCTMTHENLPQIPDFIKWARDQFPGLYAMFFSVYKGDNPRFKFTNHDISKCFEVILPRMDELLDDESRALLRETIDEKCRIIQGIRFPNNDKSTCYLSLTERAVMPDGTITGCSHLLRDGVILPPGTKHMKCLYGCNARLVAYNKCVEQEIIATGR